jgi:hypothetical protein
MAPFRLQTLSSLRCPFHAAFPCYDAYARLLRVPQYSCRSDIVPAWPANAGGPREDTLVIVFVQQFVEGALVYPMPAGRLGQNGCLGPMFH